MIVLTGENGFVLRAELAKLRDDFVHAHGEFALEVIDGSEATIERMREAMTSLPFLATQKMVILEQPGGSAQFTENIESIAENIPEMTTVIVVEPKLDKRGKYYKWLQKKTDFRAFAPLDERGLAAWAVAYAKQQGSALGRSEAVYLIQRVGVNQLRLSHEIEKLALGNSSISRERIDILTEPAPQSKIFDLLDAAFSGQTARALAVYDEQRALKVDPLEITAMIGWQLRQVALAKTAKGRNLVRDANMSSFGAGKAQRIADRLTLAELRTLVAELTRLDVRSKRGAVDLDTALRTYIVTIAARVE